MKVVLVRSPKALKGILKLIFKISDKDGYDKYVYEPAGLYNGDTLVKSWSQIREEYPEAFSESVGIVANGEDSYFKDFEGELRTKQLYIEIGDKFIGQCEMGNTGAPKPDIKK